MADRSVLYLGDSSFAGGFCNKIEAYGSCGELDRYNAIAIPDDYAKSISLIFLSLALTQNGQIRIYKPPLRALVRFLS